MPSIDTTYGQPRPPRRPTTNRQVSGTGYNPAAYVPGGSSAAKARAIQSKGGKRPPAYKPPTTSPRHRAPTQTQPPKQTAQAPAAAPAYDYDADPVLQRIQGLTGQDREFAQAGALDAKKKLAIDYGDDSLARQLGDENTALAAANNPIGVRQQLRKGYDENVQGFENDLDSTLFYSGYRGNQLGKIAGGYQEALAGAGQQQQGLLSEIERSLADALMDADYRDANAQAEAAQRAISQGMLGGDADPAADPMAGQGGDPIADALAGAAPSYTPMAGEPTFAGANGPVKPLDIEAILRTVQAPKRSSVRLPGGGGSFNSYGI